MHDRPLSVLAVHKVQAAPRDGMFRRGHPKKQTLQTADHADSADGAD